MIDQGISLFKWFSSGLEKEDLQELLNKNLLTECTYNISLIDCLNLDKLDQKSIEVPRIVALMETSYLELYQYEKIKNKTFFKWFIDENIDHNELENEDLIHNILLKIKLLKAIGRLPFKENEGYKSFRLKVRLNNLKDKLEKLSIQLNSNPIANNEKLALN